LAAAAVLIATETGAKSNEALQFSGQLMLFQHSSSLNVGGHTYRVRLNSRQSQRVFADADINFSKISCFKINGRGRVSSNTDEIGFHLFNIEQISSMHSFSCDEIP
jgi:hypothetical protein